MFLFPPHDLDLANLTLFFLLFPVKIELSGPQPANTSNSAMTRGRLGRKPANRLQKSFLIEKGVKGSQLKKELTLGGRVNINDLDGGLWLKPSVVLRQLTVTIGGFRIELLPGPCYAQSVNTSQSASFDDGISFGKDIGLVLPDNAVNVQNPLPENESKMDVEKSTADDAALGLGPYVNPNEVQTSNGALKGGPDMQETKLDNQSDNPGKEKLSSKEKEGIKQPENDGNNRTTDNKTDSKEKQQIVAKNVLKSKQGQVLISNKNKDISCKSSNMAKELQVSQNTASKITQRVDVHKIKSLKEKKNITPMKRPVENTQSEHVTKVQKIQGTGDVKVKSKSSPPSSAVKKSPSSSNRPGDQQGAAKPTPQNSCKAETAQQALSRPGPAIKPAEEAGQEKPKVKKTEKLLQRQKSKNSRSISLDEPQLFIPDNAPVVKKEAAEDQSAISENVWDGNNCCGLCKKHHNNM